MKTNTMKKQIKILVITLVSLGAIIIVGFAIKETCDANGNADEIVNSFNKTLLKQDGITDSIKKHADSLRILNNTYRSTLSEEEKKKYDENPRKIENEVNALAKHLSDSLDKKDKK